MRKIEIFESQDQNSFYVKNQDLRLLFPIFFQIIQQNALEEIFKFHDPDNVLSRFQDF